MNAISFPTSKSRQQPYSVRVVNRGNRLRLRDSSILHESSILKSFTDAKELARPIWQTHDTWRDTWHDTDETNVLDVRVARSAEDEKHLCPMPLDLTERCIRQYTNPHETVFSPFMGIGSEGFVALRQGRRFIGVEGPAGDVVSSLEAAE